MIIKVDMRDDMGIPKELYENMIQTGSSIICNPPVTDTGIDFVIYTKSFDRLLEWLMKERFKQTSEDAYDISDESGFFCCFRKKKVNLIVVVDKELFNKWVEATLLAKRLNLRSKEQRVELFRYFFEN